MMSALEQIKQYQALWTTVIPHIKAPPPEDVARWFAFSTNAVEHAVMRTARRFAREKIGPTFDPTQAYKYATATARNIAEQDNAPHQVSRGPSTTAAQI